MPVQQMKFKETHYTGYDGTRMFMASWIPDNERPRALLIAIHGLGSHALDLFSIGEYFADNGIAVFAPDMRGFGHFDGLKGHVMRFDEYVEDIQNIVMQVKDRFLNKLTYLYGSSLGGVKVLRYVVVYPKTVDGILLHCPAVFQTLDINPLTKFFANVLSLLNVKRYFDIPTEYEESSRSPEVVKRHEEDPLRFEQVTPRFGIEALKASAHSFTLGPRILLPVLIQQAGADRQVSPEKGQEFFDTIASADKEFRLYEGLYHELAEEPEKEQVLGDMNAWLEKRLPS
ncbi:MAG: alpha/beta hydrolase [Candidatus Thorarchaeota archaeon]